MLKVNRNIEDGTIPAENMASALEAIKGFQEQSKERAPFCDKSDAEMSSTIPSLAVVPETDVDVSQEDDWTPVRSRRKAQQKQDSQKGEVSKPLLMNG
ncbi:hypothetical protein RIF29_34474 [Crotalaria pallida]|uniref:Uncharacterized protein n=1 Tax=Crotalaria pallida TaxID=3830 RepID=A0AAN9HTD4_CROPI